MLVYTQEQIHSAREEVIRAQIERFHEFYAHYFSLKETNLMVNYFFDKLYNLEGKDEWTRLAVDTFNKVKNMIKEQTKANIEQLIYLNELTDRLDILMANYLLNRGWEKGDRLSRKEYDEFFIDLGYAEDREEQLKAVLKNMKLFYELAHRPVNAVIMKPARFMSKVLGVYPLFASVEEGYYAVLPVNKELFEKFYKEVELKEWDYLYKTFPNLKKKLV